MLVIVAIPRALGAGLVLFLLVVTFSTYVGGLRLGLLLSAAAVPGATEPERVYQVIRQVAKAGPLDDDFSLMALTFS